VYDRRQKQSEEIITDCELHRYDTENLSRDTFVAGNGVVVLAMYGAMYDVCCRSFIGKEKR
jgi:hypothetical protein